MALQRDYQDGTQRETATGKTVTMALVGSNVLSYQLSDGAAIVVRPSGTEPKIKVYLLVTGSSSPDCQEKLARYAAWAEGLKDLAN